MTDIDMTPHSPEIERLLVGAALQSISLYRAAVERGITSDDFHILRLRSCWKAIKRYADEDIQPDIIAVLDELERKRDTDGIDYEFLHSCQNRAENATYDGIQESASRLLDYSMRRHLITCAGNIVQNAHDLETPALDTLIKTMVLLQHTAESGNTHDVVVADVAENFKLEIFESIAKETPPGIMTGLTDLDSILKGLKGGRSGLIGGRPGQGKTSFMLTVLVNIATKTDKAIVFNSMEMSPRGLIGRLISNVAELDGSLLDDPKNMDYDQQEKLKWAVGLIKSWKLKIITHRDPITLYARIAQLSATEKCDILFNDYIGKFEANAESRVRQVGIASAQMSKIALDLDMPVITAAQVSRTIDKRGDESELVLSDLKETGDLEQDADWVMFINPDKTMNSVKHCKVAKYRYGPTGSLDLIFRQQYSRFVNCVSRKIDMEGVRDES